MSKRANKRGTPRKQKRKKTNGKKRRPETIDPGKFPKEVEAALEIMAFTAFFMIESKFAVGRARIIDNKELEESFVVFSRDAQALQYIQYQILQAFPDICSKIMNDVVGALQSLPPHVRTLFTNEQKAIEEHGKEALRIPEDVIKRLEEFSNGAKQLTNPDETEKFTEDAVKGLPEEKPAPPGKPFLCLAGEIPPKGGMITDKPIKGGEK